MPVNTCLLTVGLVLKPLRNCELVCSLSDASWTLSPVNGLRSTTTTDRELYQALWSAQTVFYYKRCKQG